MSEDRDDYGEMLARRDRARGLLAELVALDCGRLDSEDPREGATWRFLKSWSDTGPQDRVWDAANDLFCIRDYEPEVFIDLAELVEAIERATCGDDEWKRPLIEAMAALYGLDDQFSARLFNSRIDPTAGEL